MSENPSTSEYGKPIPDDAWAKYDLHQGSLPVDTFFKEDPQTVKYISILFLYLILKF